MQWAWGQCSSWAWNRAWRVRISQDSGRVGERLQGICCSGAERVEVCPASGQARTPCVVCSLGHAGPHGVGPFPWGKPGLLGAWPWGLGRGGGGTYQGLMGLVTRERQNSVCRSRRRHSHSIWPEPWPWRLELTTNLSRYGVPPSTGSVVRMAAALYLAQQGRGRLGPLLGPQAARLCPSVPALWGP